MDRGGASGSLALWGVGITLLLAGFGFAYSLGQSVAEINRKLDRNCVYIKDISIGLKIHVASVPGVDDHVARLFPDVTC